MVTVVEVKSVDVEETAVVPGSDAVVAVKVAVARTSDVVSFVVSVAVIGR
jgi:hypothetical protein